MGEINGIDQTKERFDRGHGAATLNSRLLFGVWLMALNSLEREVLSGHWRYNPNFATVACVWLIAVNPTWRCFWSGQWRYNPDFATVACVWSIAVNSAEKSGLSGQWRCNLNCATMLWCLIVRVRPLPGKNGLSVLSLSCMRWLTQAVSCLGKGLNVGL